MKKTLNSLSSTGKIAVGVAGSVATVVGSVLGYNALTNDENKQIETKNKGEEIKDNKIIESTSLPESTTVILDEPIEEDFSTEQNQHIEVETNKTNIPFENVIVENNELPKGEERIIQEGKNGYIEETTNNLISNGKEIKKEVVATNKIDPVKEIKEVGTKTEKNESSEIKADEVSNESSQQENSSLDNVESSQESQGETEQSSEGLTEQPKEETTEQISEDNNDVVETPEQKTEIVEEQVTIEPNIVYEEDNSLLVGEEYVKQQGKPKIVKITKELVESNGITTEKTISEEIIDNGLDTIIVKGTLENTITEKTHQEVEELEYETELIDDPTLEAGKQKIIQLGVNGKKIKNYKQIYINDELSEQTLVSENIIDPVNEIIYVGTKVNNKGEVLEDKIGLPGAEVELYTEVEDNSFDLETIVQEDNTKPIGYTKVIEEGRPTISRKTYQVIKVGGLEKERKLLNVKVIQEGVKRVVVTGTLETVKTTKTTQEFIDFNTLYQEDSSLYIGEEKVIQEGQEGIKTIITEYDTINGIDTNPKIISTEITKEPVNKIILKGTKDKTQDIINPDTTYNLSATQGYEVGKMTTNGRKIIKVNINKDYTMESIDNLSESEQYNIAQQDIVNSLETKKGNERNLASGVPLTRGSIDFVNSHLDNGLLNKYMLELINKERTSKGVAPLTYREDLQKGADVRALEQAEIGNLRSNGKAHTRPDGTSHNTAFEYLGTTVGENIAQFGTTNPYLMLNEKALAEKLFTQWKASKGHYANMMNKNYKSVSFAVKVGLNHNTSPEYSDLYNSVIGVQIFK